LIHLNTAGLCQCEFTRWFCHKFVTVDIVLAYISLIKVIVLCSGRANIFLILYEICEYLYIKSKFVLTAVEWKTRMMPK